MFIKVLHVSHNNSEFGLLNEVTPIYKDLHDSNNDIVKVSVGQRTLIEPTNHNGSQESSQSNQTRLTILPTRPSSDKQKQKQA